MLLWLIDDSPEHHRVAAATATLAGVDFTGYASGREGIAAFARAARQRKGVPDAVLMDYYLGDDRGDAVTRRLRELEPAQYRPVIIGYSSVAEASRRIVESGGDLVLRKHATAEGINPSLLEWLRRTLRTSSA